jgi:transposase-like protein
VLVELSVMEQRYQAVLAVVQDGWKVVEVAERLGVSRQAVHNWIVRYEHGGLIALTDRSRRRSPVGPIGRTRPWIRRLGGEPYRLNGSFELGREE